MEPFSVAAAMVSWLSSLGYAASSRVPASTPAELVTVERTGGGVADLVDRPLVAVQCWAETDERAEALANEVRLALVSSRPPAGIHSVRVNAGPYQLNDPATRSPRYQLALDVSCQIATTQ